jgi:PAS domain S-box-containing protein
MHTIYNLAEGRLISNIQSVPTNDALDYRVLLEQLPGIIYINALGETCATLYMSRQVEPLLGYSQEECLTDPAIWRKLIHPDDFERVEEACTYANTTGQPLCEEYRMFSKTGELLWVRDEALVLCNTQGEGVCWQGILIDITTQKRTEQEHAALQQRLITSQRHESLAALAGGIAHDFNNLLATILGYADMMLATPTLQTDMRESLEAISAASRQAAHLTRQMLAYSGHGRFQLETLDLTSLLSHIPAQLASSLPTHIDVTVEAPTDLPFVEADLTQIQQLLHNLVRNGIEALGEHAGTIQLRTWQWHTTADDLAIMDVGHTLPPGLYVACEIRDTGCGMDEATRQRIFEPFFSTKFAGRGLGMAAVLGIVQGHGGAMRVTSAPGQGTSVLLLFPAVARAASTASPVFHTTRPFACMLVVEDEALLRELVTRMLTRLGIQVLLAPDGAAGVDLFRKYADTIDGVLLDLTMPKMNGDVAAHFMRAIKPTVPIILMSGYDQVEVGQRFQSLETQGFIHKPFTYTQLKAALATAQNRGSNAVPPRP